MVKEEWRLHSRLFGRWGFGAFPLVILAFSAVVYGLMVFSGYAIREVEVGLHYVVFFLGLNVGSVGFVSRDAIQNLLGESNLLIFSSRTLPVSNRRVLAAFVVKDLVYYSFLYLTPLVVGLVPVYVYFGGGSSPPFLSLFLWFTTTGAFTLGVSLSFLAATLQTRGTAHVVALGVVLGVVALYFGFDVIDFTPLAFFETPSPARLLTFVPPVVLSAVGVYAFTPRSGDVSRSYADRFSFFSSVPFDDRGLVAKMLIDVTRSSGGVWKLFVSVGILFGVFVFLVHALPFVSDIVTSPGIAFAVLLSTSSVSVYHWLNRFDDLSNYLMLPVDAGDVIDAKFRTELAVSLPISYAYLAVGVVLFPSDVRGIVAGAFMLPFLTLYTFGVTVYLTGLNPNELLLNSKLFAVFTFVVAVVAVPLFVGSFVYVRYAVEVTAFSLVVSVVAGVVGYAAYRKSRTKWKRNRDRQP